MNYTPNNNTKLNRKTSIDPISSFLKALAIYAVSYVFWILLFITNDGPGGVEFQHLVIIGISHVILILIHGLSAYKSKGSVSP
jgi:hypothetical protein